MSTYVKKFADIQITDIAMVGGKNASLGEMLSSLTPKGINVPDGFATTAEAFRYFLDCNELPGKLALQEALACGVYLIKPSGEGYCGQRMGGGSCSVGGRR